MAKNALFRSSIGGYNKDDVNRYIEELAIQYSDRGNELESEIKGLKKELEIIPSLMAEKERAERLSIEVEALKKENDEIKESLEARIREFAEKEAQLAEEKAKMAADFELKNRELEVLSAEAEALRKQLENDKSEFEKKSEEMLSNLQAQAKNIIDKANETAADIIAKAKRNFANTPDNTAAEETAPKKKESVSEYFDTKKSKMDSFFSAIAKTLRGDK